MSEALGGFGKDGHCYSLLDDAHSLSRGGIDEIIRRPSVVGGVGADGGMPVSASADRYIR